MRQTNILTESSIYPTKHTIGGVSLMGMASMIDAYEGGGINMADTWNILEPFCGTSHSYAGAVSIKSCTICFFKCRILSIACEVGVHSLLLVMMRNLGVEPRKRSAQFTY